MCSKPKVSLYRLPRSGSTMAKRALRATCNLVQSTHELFKPTAPLVVTVRDFRDVAYSTHELFKPTAPLVVTVRDFRDVAYSQWRIRWGHFKRPPKQVEVAMSVELVNKRAAQLMAMATDNPDHRVWWYEVQYGNPDALVDLLADMFPGHDWTHCREVVAEAYDVDGALAVQAAIKPKRPRFPFTTYDPKTLIHANHIGPERGRPGAWRTGIPEKYHNAITVGLRKHLEFWGYLEDE